MEKYTMFLDESGDARINPKCENNGVLCIPGIIISEVNYEYIIKPQFENFKEKLFGTKDIVLHGTDIKWKRGHFEFLNRECERTKKFYDGLETLMSGSPYRIIAVYIDKKRHCEQYITPFDPYELALEFLLEKYEKYLIYRDFSEGNIIAEQRGKKEDNALHKKVITLLKYGTKYNQSFNQIDGIEFKPKKENIIGLQISDLIANPLMKKIKSPSTPNYPYETFKKRIYFSDHYGPGFVIGTGIKIFPSDYNYRDDMFL